jgi:drug/metabolite transporter (DMT)-like permease
MSTTRILGVVLLIVGAVLIVIGIIASRSVADSVSSMFTGRLSRNTLWYIIGGGTSALIGLLLALGVVGRSRS